MNRRRRIRRKPVMRGGKKIQVNFAPIIVIICLSVCAGYLTAKYVVYPILGYEPTGLQIFKDKAEDKKKETKQAKTEPTTAQSETTTAAPATTQTTAPTTSKVVEDKVDVKQTAGYALQFGSYSSKAAAEKSRKQLKNSGINAKIVQKDGAFKVIGELYNTKDKARAALAKMDESVGAFVTTVDR